MLDIFQTIQPFISLNNAVYLLQSYRFISVISISNDSVSLLPIIAGSTIKKAYALSMMFILRVWTAQQCLGCWDITASDVESDAVKASLVAIFEGEIDLGMGSGGKIGRVFTNFFGVTVRTFAELFLAVANTPLSFAAFPRLPCLWNSSQPSSIVSCTRHEPHSDVPDSCSTSYGLRS